MADAARWSLVPKRESMVAHRSSFNGAALSSGNAARPHDGPCATPKPWQLPSRGFAVFHGPGDTARLSHYFMPRLLLQGKHVLFLDGANSADPRLLARLARERGVPFEQFSRQIQIARAFTCFQLTELIARVPRFTADFPAQALIVTALPELYYDEDVRDWDARVAFEQALANLRRWVRLPLSVAVFSAAPSRLGSPARRRFFPQTCAVATEVWEFSLGKDNQLNLFCTRSQEPEVSRIESLSD